MNDLQLVNTDDLITELLNRQDHAIFMGIKLPKNNDIVSVRRWKGNSYTCCGLCNSLIKNILENYESEEEPITKDEF